MAIVCLWAAVAQVLACAGAHDGATFSSTLDGSQWIGHSYDCGPPLAADQWQWVDAFSLHPTFSDDSEPRLELDLGAAIGSLELDSSVFLAAVDESPSDSGFETFSAQDVHGFSIVTVTVYVDHATEAYLRLVGQASRDAGGPYSAIPDHMVGMATLDDGTCLAFTAFPFEAAE